MSKLTIGYSIINVVGSKKEEAFFTVMMGKAFESSIAVQLDDQD